MPTRREIITPWSEGCSNAYDSVCSKATSCGLPLVCVPESEQIRTERVRTADLGRFELAVAILDRHRSRCIPCTTIHCSRSYVALGANENLTRPLRAVYTVSKLANSTTQRADAANCGHLCTPENPLMAAFMLEPKHSVTMRPGTVASFA
jgi:hypothetical protein